jgi:hypothetical protein
VLSSDVDKHSMVDRRACNHLRMQAFGSGAEHWRVRVAVLANGATIHDMEAVIERLRRRLEAQPGVDDGWGVCGEYSTGEAGDQVVGASFWVAADDVGDAASTAVATLVTECEGLTGRSHHLYEVLVVPHGATREEPRIHRLSRDEP